MYTNQKVFNKVWDIFIVKGIKKAFDEKECVCVYSHKINGYGCAIGCCLPKSIAEKVEKEQGGNTVEDIFNDMSDIYNAYFKNCDLDFLMTLQNWHDAYCGNKSRLKNIAKNYGLAVPSENAVL